MEVIDTLKTLGCEVILVENKIKVRSLPGANPDISKIQPLVEKIRGQKQEAIAYLSSQVKFCSWREMAVPAGECVKPCYRFDPGRGKQCKHLLLWWEERLKWLERDGLSDFPTHTQKGQAIPFSPEADCFDPDGALASLLECARRKGIGDAQVASIVDDLIRTKSLKAPWGIKIKNSPVLGDYWLVSDDQAKKLVPKDEVSFTQEDIRLLAEIREIFGARVVEVKKR